MNWDSSYNIKIKFLIFLGIFLFSIFINFPASAKDRFYPDKVWGNVSGWLIYWNNLKTSCVASGKYRDGTIFWMGRGGENGKHKFIAFANKNWSGIKEFKDYRFNVVFNGRRNWKGNFYGIKVESLGISGFEVQRLNNRFFNEIARASNVAFYLGQKRIMKLRLKGTSRAIKALYKCDNKIASSGKIDFSNLESKLKKEKQNSNNFPKEIDAVVEKWHQKNAGCRGGSGDKPSTWNECEKRALLTDALNEKGYCYGHDDDKGTFEYKWHKCREGSFGHKKSNQSNTTLPKSTERLIDEWGHSYENCRGGNFEFPETKKACIKKSKMEKKLNSLGYCFGHKDDKATAEFDWHKCRSGSFKSE